MKEAVAFAEGDRTSANLTWAEYGSFDFYCQTGPRDLRNIPPQMKGKKVAIIGSASSTIDETPWGDRSVEIWSLAWRKVPRADVLFEMHRTEAVKRDAKVPHEYEKILNRIDCPIIMQEKHSDITKSIRYPIEYIRAAVGPMLDPFSDGDYFVSSIAYMLAFALYLGYEEIHLYGIDLVTDSEYGYQKPNAEYLIGMARGLGRKVYIPENSALCRNPYRYGYESRHGEVGPITTPMLEKRLKDYQEKREQALSIVRTADGAIQECTDLLGVLHHHKRGLYVGRRDTSLSFSVSETESSNASKPPEVETKNA
jgi:hypothetical protein